MKRNPLAEVFGYPISNNSEKVKRFRKSKLCPYNNISPNCTKDKANDPLGVCSVFNGDSIAITCPVRFREDWLIASDVAEFFFGGTQKWTSLSEIRLNDANGKSAGNIDLVLVSYDNEGKVTDFGAVEIQGVYISGNVRQPFENFMSTFDENFSWDINYNYPKPDYLSSSRKRLIPQLTFKGGILNSWGKKICVVLHEAFFNTLPNLVEVEETEADLAWFVYGLALSSSKDKYDLVRRRVIYSKFSDAMNRISLPVPGNIVDFFTLLQLKLDEKFDNEIAPDIINPIDLLKN